jgi:ribosomal protein S18 acetylase RimI-like enzyme
MIATESIDIETSDEKFNATPTKRIKRGKRTLQPANSNGIMENGNGSLTEVNPSRLTKKNSEKKTVNESNLETSTNSQPPDQNLTKTTNQLYQTLTPIESFQPDETNHKNAKRFENIELNVVTDDEDDNNKRELKQKIQPKQSTLTDHSTMVQSYTSGENDVIEIHEFSLADIDAYLDIYFETLTNRLRHFIGEDEQLQQFRLAMKNRINSDTNSREYHNVLLGKMNGEVVAAVTLSFPGERTTIVNDNILPEANSCIISVRRWMVRNANYIPTNMEECYIEMIGVKSAYRNHGIGAAMLECVEHFARQAGAVLLTVHVNGEQLRNYFERFGFDIDHTDNSGFWKWIVERQSIQKMCKTLSPDEEYDGNPLDNGSYFNESMVGSEIE